jgi:hypothetical protein
MTYILLKENNIIYKYFFKKLIYFTNCTTEFEFGGASVPCKVFVILFKPSSIDHKN